MRSVKRLVLSAVFLALGMVLPLFTGQIREIGNMLLLMHIPVMLCGLICGYKYGLAIGLVMPLLRSAVFLMPVFYPNAVCMAVELAVYGLVVGLMYEKLGKKNTITIYVSLIIAMLSGRIIWGIVMKLLLAFGAKSFTFTYFFTIAFLNAVPGILLQLILIPAIMLILKKSRLIKE